MRISAKADYAVRATIELAVGGEDAVVKGECLADAQHIPLHFLENILGDLKQAGIVATRRGPEGGYKLVYAVTGRGTVARTQTRPSTDD